MPRGPSKDERRLYGDLAWTWPILSPPEDYADEAEEARALLEAYARGPVRTLLHLGCGGGHLDRTWKKHLEVTGADVSDAMLALARALNPEVAYLRGDMRFLRLGKTFDAVAILDSIDYMLTPEDLRAAFVTAFEHLRPGGVFLTYAEETLEGFVQNRTRVTLRSRGDVHIAFLENAFDPNPKDTTFEQTFVSLIRKGGRLSVEEDHHLCGLFPARTWKDLLLDAGFDLHTARAQSASEGGAEVPWYIGVKPG